MIQAKAWELIMKKYCVDYEKILLHISEPSSKENITIIKQLCAMKTKLQSIVTNFAMAALNLYVGICVKNPKYSRWSSWSYSDKFKNNVYYYIISQHCNLDVEG